MFGLALYESVIRYPQVLTATELQRRLGIAKNSATLLKRRLQLFTSDQMPKIKKLIHKELAERFTNFEFPRADVDLKESINGHAIPQADVCILYSSKPTANKGRKRTKYRGTSSVYMNDALGGRQIGSIIHTLSWQKGPAIFDAVQGTDGNSIGPLLTKYLSVNCPLFTDEGYKFYYRVNKNHRMVNHSRKSVDKRYRWARNRWCRNSVNNAVAEGNNRVLKYSFISGYSYISAEYMPLYLSEFSFIKSLRYYGWKALVEAGENGQVNIKYSSVGVVAQPARPPGEQVALAQVRDSY